MSSNSASVVRGVVLLVLAVLVVVGVFTFARPCGVHDDGSVSTCFWAGRAVLGAGVVLVCLAVLRLAVPDAGVKGGLSIASALLGVLVAAIPGGLVDLCMMATMRCNTVMHPVDIVLGVAVAAVALADAALLHRAGRKGAQASHES